MKWAPVDLCRAHVIHYSVYSLGLFNTLYSYIYKNIDYVE